MDWEQVVQVMHYSLLRRVIVGIDYAHQHKELVAVAYDQDKDQPHKSPGVICVWNTKFKATSPEYVLVLQSS